jgi:hypothetical protein
MRRNDWHRTRSTHASVLESLEAVIARHPSLPQSTVTPTGERLAPVVELRPRLAVVPDGDGDDAA